MNISGLCPRFLSQSLRNHEIPGMIEVLSGASGVILDKPLESFRMRSRYQKDQLYD